MKNANTITNLCKVIQEEKSRTPPELTPKRSQRQWFFASERRVRALQRQVRAAAVAIELVAGSAFTYGPVLGLSD